jgi:VWFA-related protein
MGRFPRIALSVLAFAVLSATASLSSQQAPPVFRAGVDLIELDVSAIDKDRRPVLDLTAADFTVTVDGQPRPIVAFKAVDLTPPEIAPAARWVRETAPDVSTNSAPAGRVVVILMDDGSFNQVDDDMTAAKRKPVVDQQGVRKMREVARTVVNEIGPDDLAAVVFTENNHTAETFTNDKKRLLAAIETSAIYPGMTIGYAPPRGDRDIDFRRAVDAGGDWRGNCVCGVCSISALEKVALALRSLPHQRKVVVYISAGIIVPMEIKDNTGVEGAHGASASCGPMRHLAMARAFRQAALANVTVQAIDPKGLDTTIDDIARPIATARLNFLRTVAEQTGGRAVVNNNDMERAVPAVLAESSSYYLLGVEQPIVKDDGRFHPIRVRVNRPGVEVRTRTGFYAPTDKERQAAAVASESRDLNAAVGAALPKADVPMSVGVAPLLGADRKSAVALVVGIRPKNAGADGARTETIELSVGAFNPETGDHVTTRRQKMSVVWNPTDGTSSGEYEVLTRMPLSPGRYELRVGMKGSDGRTASVYTTADVPNFSKGDLALSGLVLSATPRPKVGGEAELGGLLPILPTARRTFRASDRVTGFVRVYEGNAKTFAPVAMTVRIVDTMDTTLSTSTQTVTSADYQFQVPLAGLAPGEYLLAIDAVRGTTTQQRSVRFKVER